MALTSTGRVYAWGFNNSGQIGDATTTNRNIPTEITSRISGTVTSIAAGGNHSFALTSTGRVYAWGYNLYGQIGDATKINRTVPTEITSRISGMVTSVAAGGNHSIALTSTGRIYTWGLNSSGEIGDATTTNRTTPTEITSRIAVTASMISAGYSHSAAITSTGRVYTWGSNSNGQIGDATTTNKNVPTEISSRINGTVTSISAGGIHTIVLTSTGRIVAWGYNGYGQLGDSTNVDKIIPKDTSYFLAKEALTIKTSLYDYGQVTSPYNQSRAGYTFSGWYSDINLTISYAFSTMPAFDVTLYGKYIPVS